MLRYALPLLALLTAACEAEREDEGPIAVSFIGETPELADLVSTQNGPAAIVLLSATAQGLVALDADGQVEPALARRWILLDDGLSYIFRLHELSWKDGERLTARQVARDIDSARTRNGLVREIAEVNAVTPEILEITLRHPRADFLQLLAQSGLSVMRDREGLGPFEIAGASDSVIQLAFRVDASRDGAGQPESDHSIGLRFEPVGRAVARFKLGMSDLVLDGSWLDLSYAEAIGPGDRQLVLDPVEGLFGLGFVEDSGFLADPANREALAMAIDRDRIVALFERVEAEGQRTIVPDSATGIARLTLPVWTGADLASRRTIAADRIAQWTQAAGEISPLRIALPDLPDSRHLFAEIQASWRAIGVESERVLLDADADLRLVDQVAPSDSAEWYLNRFRCGGEFACAAEIDDLLDAADGAANADERARLFTEADGALSALVPFIPLMRPIRWSLVSPRLTGFRANRYASHPLDALLEPAR